MIRLDAARLGVAFLIFLINVLTRRLILQWDWGAIPYLFTGTVLGHLLGGFWGKKWKEGNPS